MRIEADISEVAEFFGRLTDEDLFKEHAKAALLAVANSFLDSVRKRTPVYGQPNPVTGRAWNWPRYPDHPRGQLKAAWTKDNKNLEARVVERPDGFEIQLVNNTDYASFVEKGHRKFIYGVEKEGEWVYGSFFLKKTEIEFENGKLSRIVALRIGRWIREVANG